MSLPCPALVWPDLPWSGHSVNSFCGLKAPASQFLYQQQPQQGQHCFQLSLMMLQYRNQPAPAAAARNTPSSLGLVGTPTPSRTTRAEVLPQWPGYKSDPGLSQHVLPSLSPCLSHVILSHSNKTQTYHKHKHKRITKYILENRTPSPSRLDIADPTSRQFTPHNWCFHQLILPQH